MLGLRRIDRYVIREVIGPTVLGFSLFTFLLLMNAFFFVAQKTIAKNLGWDLTLRMFALEMPQILILTLPMATLLGSLIAVGRLSADQEWIALQGAGQGAAVLSRPLAIIGLCATLVCLGLYWEIVPRSNFAARQLRGELVLAANTAADLTPRTFYAQLDDVVLFIDEIRPGQTDGRLDRVFIAYRNRESGRDELILANQGRIQPRGDRSGDLRIDLWDAASYAVDPKNPEDYTIQRFQSQSRTHPAPAFVRALQAPPDAGVYDLTTVDLVDELRLARGEPDPVLRAVRVRTGELELHMRLALPVACLLFALLAVPLGVVRARSGKGAGFALSIGVFVVYYVVFIAARDLAIDGAVPPWVGAWSATFVLLPWWIAGSLRLSRPGAEDRGILARAARWVSALGHLIRRASPARVENPELDDETAARPEVVPHRHGGTASRLVGRLDAYVGRQYLRIFMLALSGCYLLFVIVELRSLVGEAVRSGIPASTLARYFAYYSPGMLPYILPIACLTGGIVAITVLARSGELTAVKASGISVRRVSAPLMILTLALCGVFFLVQDRVAPEANQKRLELKDQIENRAPRTYGLPSGGGWAFGSDGSRLYHFAVYDEVRRQFRDLSVLTLDRERFRFVDHRHADVASWTGSAWDTSGFWERTLPEVAGDPSSFRQAEQEVLTDLDPPSHFESSAALLERRTSKVADQMSVAELGERIASLRNSGYDTTRLEVAYHAKYSQASAPLVMLLLGLPFAFRIGRRGSLYGIGVAILLVVVYWATLATFQALGSETILPPVLAAWAPNVMYGLLGAYLLLYVRT